MSAGEARDHLRVVDGGETAADRDDRFTRPDEPPHGSPELRALRERLEAISRSLQASHDLREAVMNARVATAQDLALAAPVAASSRRRRLVAAGAGLLAAGAFGGAVVTAATGGDDTSAVTPARAAAPAAPPPCTDGTTGTCMTGTLLTIAGSRGLQLPGLEVPTARAVADKAGVVLRMELRNTGTRTVTVAGARDLWLNLSGKRLQPLASTEPVELSPGEGAAVTRRFRLGAGSRAALRRAGNRVDVGVVPPRAASGDTTRRLGVLRLTAHR